MHIYRTFSPIITLQDFWVGILRVLTACETTRVYHICIFAYRFDFDQYFLEVQPLLRDLPLPIFNWLDNVLVEKEKDFDVIHPVPPSGLPNFVKGLEGQLRYGSPDGITETKILRFMVGIDFSIGILLLAE